MLRDTLIAPVDTIDSAGVVHREDLLAVEEPLEIRVNGATLSITMRTPGHDTDLAAGFLFAEGIVEDPADIRSIRLADTMPNPRQAANTILVELAEGVEFDAVRLQRNFLSSSSCGVCGKASIRALEISPRRIMPDPVPLFDAGLVHRLPQILRDSQAVFDRTGGLHAAALFSPAGELLGLREDIGRHNAVDKVIGFALRGKGLPLSESLLLVSGRAGFELIQKAVMAGIPVLAAVGAPSSLAVETSLRFGMTLLGFVRDGRFNIYSGGSRIH